MLKKQNILKIWGVKGSILLDPFPKRGGPLVMALQSDITRRSMSSYKDLCHHYSFEGTAMLTGYDAKGTFRGNKRRKSLCFWRIPPRPW